MTEGQPAPPLLERSDQLSDLAGLLDGVIAESSGRMVLVGGEAGVGKTALLREFADRSGGEARVLWGACDGLLTPGPLAPLFDVAEVVRGELEELVAGSARPHEVASALLRQLGGRPTLLVLEDVHWADEATLDVLRLLARKVESVPLLVVVTYRDDQLDPTQPLQMLIGEVASARAVARVALPPLSLGAVSELAAAHGVSAEDLYRQTNGNAFFVTETLAAGGDQLPRTVRDAVLARAARLSDGARTLVEAAAIAPPAAELWLLEALAPEALDDLGASLASGMLVEVPGGVTFRHELSRLAIEDALPPDRKLKLHRAALDALATRATAPVDSARLAHHAEAIGDAAAVLQYAPAAGDRAAALGAHREAASQFERALRFAGDLPAQDQAELLERRAYECYLTARFDAAIEAHGAAVELWRELGDRRREGDGLRSLARLYGFVGRTEEAVTVCLEAVELLEQLEPGRELALAYATLAQRYVNWERTEEATDWGTRALELADRIDDADIRVYATTTLGVAEFREQGDEGNRKLEWALGTAREAGLEDHAARCLLNLALHSIRQRAYGPAERYLEAGREYCGDRGLDYWTLFLSALQARAELEQGRWAEADESALGALGHPRGSEAPRLYALVVLGLVRARAGARDAWPPLDEAIAHATATGELLWIGPVAAARAEAAWLEGRASEVDAATEAPLDLARRSRAAWETGELACWRWRAGIPMEIPEGAAEPYAASMGGDWSRAAALWTEIGNPYEAALALADADDDGALRRSLEGLQQLGAEAPAAIVARRLRERGVRGVRRGPRATTRANPAGLTAREVEVLELVAGGLRNAEIAGRLFLSEKTVGHHVSAILRKLEVATRAEAAVEAVRLGVAGPSEQDR